MLNECKHLSLQVLFCRLSEEQRAVYQEYLGSAEVENILRGRMLVFPGEYVCCLYTLTVGLNATNIVLIENIPCLWELWHSVINTTQRCVLCGVYNEVP